MIKVFKTLAGDEIVGMMMSTDPERGIFNVEFPFVVATDIDPETKYTYTDLMPWMYGTEFQGPYRFAAHTVSVLPMEPKPYIIKRYRDLIEQISAQADSKAATMRTERPLERAGRRLDSKKT